MNSGKEKTSKNVAIVPEEKVKPKKIELRSNEDKSEIKARAEDSEKQRSVCFALKFNKCPYKDGIGCQNRHPQKCEKFCEFGHKSIDQNGCETSECTLFPSR